MDKGEGVIVADFDAQHLADVRTRLPALQHRIFQG
jgi:predicted amidohydrolase